MSDTIGVTPIEGGVRLRLRVKPGARRTRLVGAYGGALKLEVQAPPERGKANDAVRKLLAATFGITRRSIEITAGHTGQDKTVEITDVTPAAVRQTLARKLTPTGPS